MDTYSTNNFSSRYSHGSSLPSAVKVMMFINVIIFIVLQISEKLNFPFLGIFGLVPKFVTNNFMLWQIVTYMFLHAGLWHLVINMLMLWMFGANIERMWGKGEFLIFYFFTGIGAGLCSIITSWSSMIPIVGVSGVVFGLLVAYAVMFPDNIILFFFIIPMKIKHAVWILIGINLLGALSNEAGIAYMAHLGGGLFGYIYLKNTKLRQLLMLLDPTKMADKYKRKKADLKIEKQENFELEVDRILEKISRHGIHSLTKKEKIILDKRSKK
ncbi:MAG: rhomboid family intramembrane serine protease [Candidatus Aureabacteria bacterium]|nr:rhomboid family intramembrane serine protease [Candidatus Auribacterota bacterium]